MKKRKLNQDKQDGKTKKPKTKNMDMICWSTPQMLASISFVCAYCNKRLDQSSWLKRHMIKHKQEKSYVCIDCDKG